MGVSKNRGTPKWMVYNGKPYYLMDDLGVPLFSETSIYPKQLFLFHCSLLFVWGKFGIPILLSWRLTWHFVRIDIGWLDRSSLVKIICIYI